MLAQPVQKIKTRQPFFGLYRRLVATEAPAAQVEGQQFEPILDPQHADEFCIPRRAARTRKHLAHTPQADRIEARDNQLPFGPQHTLGLAQDLVGFLGEFEQVRQQQQIE